MDVEEENMEDVGGGYLFSLSHFLQIPPVLAKATTLVLSMCCRSSCREAGHVVKLLHIMREHIMREHGHSASVL